MKYPMLCKWIHFEPIDDSMYLCRTIDTAHLCKAIDAVHEKEYIIPAELAAFASGLDGRTDPYSIGAYSESTCEAMLVQLRRFDMIRTSRILQKSLLSSEISLWIPKDPHRGRIAATIFNTLLILLWAPVLALGSYAIMTNIPFLSGHGYVSGFLVGMLLGLFIHELSHANASISYGAPFFEMGILFGILPGAYILTDSSRVNGRWKRLQISAAGVESNFLLTGLFFLLAARVHFLATFAFSAAMVNLVLGLLNLTLVRGFDGSAILNELMGEKNFVSKARSIVKNKAVRNRLKKSATGQAAIVSSYMIVVAQVASPLLIVLNFIELYFIII